MNLRSCVNCGEHYILGATTCPHCCVEISLKVPSVSRASMALLMGLGLTACPGITPEPKYGAPYVEEDIDEDGFMNMEDCDDNDPNTYPGAAENDSTEECMTDLDGDGFGDENAEYATTGTDCDDTDPNIHPNAEEIPDDGVDSNCDGEDNS